MGWIKSYYSTINHDIKYALSQGFDVFINQLLQKIISYVAMSMSIICVHKSWFIKTQEFKYKYWIVFYKLLECLWSI